MNKNLQDKLKAYTAVAGSLVAASASGQVIYTDINPDTIVHDTLIYGLDLNNDAITDFVFSTPSYNTTYGTVHIAAVNVVGDTNNAVLGSLYYGVYPFPYSMNAGDSIKPNSMTWSPYGPTSGINYLGVTVGSQYYYGNFLGVNDKYLGLRIKSGGQFYYGWARLSVSSAADSITIKEYAIEALPNTPITAGQLTGIQSHQLASGVRIHSYENTLFIHTPAEQQGGVVSVYSMTGELIRKEEITGNEMTINLQNQATGMYIVHVSNGTTETTGKIYLR